MQKKPIKPSLPFIPRCFLLGGKHDWEEDDNPSRISQGKLPTSFSCKVCHIRAVIVGASKGEVQWSKRTKRTVDEKPMDCPFNNRFCNKQGCAIWDNDAQRCSLLSIAINTKRL